MCKVILSTNISPTDILSTKAQSFGCFKGLDVNVKHLYVLIICSGRSALKRYVKRIGSCDIWDFGYERDETVQNFVQKLKVWS
jgi:hypothetical protein